MPEPEWFTVCHVEPPEPRSKDDRRLIFYLGPNHYPAGLYLPEGYDLEAGWTLFRARDSISGAILTQWAVQPDGVPLHNPHRTPNRDLAHNANGT